MKKETRVKDLPLILRELVKRELPVTDLNYVADIFTRIDWQKCSNEERLAFAEFMYPVGTEIKSTYGTCAVINSGKFEIDNGECIYEVGSEFEIYSDRHNKWATIFSTPEEKPEPIDLKDTGAFSTEPVEFKKGEMVECTSYDHKSHWRKMTYAGFMNGKHWVKIMDEAHLQACEEIRKIDPDRELKQWAEEIINDFYKDSSYKLSEPLLKDVKSMLLEMGKRVISTHQSN